MSTETKWTPGAVGGSVIVTSGQRVVSRRLRGTTLMETRCIGQLQQNGLRDEKANATPYRRSARAL